jgi:Caudovirus prohead serine protease
LKRYLDLPKQVRAASIGPSSYSESGNTVECVFATSTPVRRRWSGGSYNEVLQIDAKSVNLDRLNSGRAPLLNTHNDLTLENVIGRVVSARVSGGVGTAVLELSTAERDKDIVTKVKSGVIRNISCGYTVEAVEVVEGAAGDIPTWHIIGWTPLEISLVPIPADQAAMVRSVLQEKFPCRINKACTNAQRRRRMKLRFEVMTYSGAKTVHRTDIRQPPEVRPWR